MCYYKRASYENLKNEELLILAKLRIADGYENTSRQQLKITSRIQPAPRTSLDQKRLQDIEEVSMGKYLEKNRSYYRAMINSFKK